MVRYGNHLRTSSTVGRTILAGLAAVLVLATAAWAQEESRYQGRTTTYWLKQLETKDFATRLAAMEALRAIGPEAKAAAPTLLGIAKENQRESREAALRALEQIGPAATDAVPTFITFLKESDPFRSKMAAHVLGAMGTKAEAAVPHLLQRLQEENQRVRKKEASVLGSNDHTALRQALAEALGRMGARSKAAVPTLIELSEDPYPEVRAAAVQGLAGIGADSLPALREALKHKDVGVRRTAVWALASIGPVAVPSLVEALKDDEMTVRQTAVQHLTKMGPKASAAIPALTEAMKDPRMADQLVGDALVQIGPDAVPFLARALKDRNTAVRVQIAIALGKFKSKAEPAIPGLIEVVMDDSKEAASDRARKYAAEALGAIGPKAVPALVEALKKENPESYEHLVLALIAIGPESKAAIPTLIEMLKELPPPLPGVPRADERGILHARRALIELGAADMPALSQALKDDDKRTSICLILGRLGPAAQAAVPVLVELLERDPARQAAMAPSVFGSPAVLRALEVRNSQLRLQVIQLLTTMGPSAKAAVPALRKLLIDPDDHIHAAAELALQRIIPQE